MDNLTISIFGNHIFLEIVNEIKLFSNVKTKFYDNVDTYIKDTSLHGHLIIFFWNEQNKKDCEKLIKKNFPLILITKLSIPKKISSNELVEKINMPFKILNFDEKIISLLARYEYKKSSLIILNSYIIDKNSRKIKKNNFELQLTEKEIDFLILFSKKNKPLSRKFVLKNVWNYSTKSDTPYSRNSCSSFEKKNF